MNLTKLQIDNPVADQVTAELTTWAVNHVDLKVLR